MEKRTRPRSLTLKTAKILADGAAAPIACAVINYSETGAALLVPRHCSVPRRFRLALDPDGVTVACRIRWRSATRIGISFEAFTDAASSRDAAEDRPADAADLGSATGVRGHGDEDAS